MQNLDRNNFNYSNLQIQNVLDSTCSIFKGKIKYLIRQLKSTVKVDLDPARSLLDLHPLLVIGSPSLDKGQPEFAKPPQVVDPDLNGSGGSGDIGRIGFGILRAGSDRKG